MTKTLTALLFFSTSVIFSTSAVAQTPLKFSEPAQYGIMGGRDTSFSAIVSEVELWLTANDGFTDYTLKYRYYNGSQRWEFNQYLNVSLMSPDPRGGGASSGVGPAITSKTPSYHCHYGPGLVVTQEGRINFDIRNLNISHIAVSGSTDSDAQDHSNHKC